MTGNCPGSPLKSDYSSDSAKATFVPVVLIWYSQDTRSPKMNKHLLSPCSQKDEVCKFEVKAMTTSTGLITAPSRLDLYDGPLQASPLHPQETTYVSIPDPCVNYDVYTGLNRHVAMTLTCTKAYQNIKMLQYTAFKNIYIYIYVYIYTHSPISKQWNLEKKYTVGYARTNVIGSVTSFFIAYVRPSIH
jgi:hypothetical protein